MLELIDLNLILSIIFISAISSMIGTLLFINKSVSLGGSIAHASFLPIGLSLFFGLSINPMLITYAIFLSIVLSFVIHYKREYLDVFIAFIWAFGMSAGVMFIELVPGYNSYVLNYLFGNLLLISDDHLIYLISSSIFIAILIKVFYMSFIRISSDIEFSLKISNKHFIIFCVMMSISLVSIIMILQVAGIVLTIALISIPPLISSLMSRSLSYMMFLSFLISLVSFFIGLYISFTYNISVGIATTVVLSMFVFLYLFKVVAGFVINKNHDN